MVQKLRNNQKCCQVSIRYKIIKKKIERIWETYKHPDGNSGSCNPAILLLRKVLKKVILLRNI